MKKKVIIIPGKGKSCLVIIKYYVYYYVKTYMLNSRYEERRAACLKENWLASELASYVRGREST